MVLAALISSSPAYSSLSEAFDNLPRRGLDLAADAVLVCSNCGSNGFNDRIFSADSGLYNNSDVFCMRCN